MYNLKANYETAVCATLVAYFMEKYSSGRRGAPAKGVGRVTGAEVQIFSSPPKQKDRTCACLFCFAWWEERFALSFVAMPQMKCINEARAVVYL